VRGLLADHPVAVAVAEDLPAVWADGAQLERVLANLLENAAKYSPPGSPIAVSAARRPDRQLELAVEDRGPGIAPHLLARVFDQFFRAPDATGQPVPGSGLGLSIARSIVLAHGGRIRAENRPDGGARLVVSLPLTPPTRAPVATP
jgi:two-component system sensor histidine kinase KdpD